NDKELNEESNFPAIVKFLSEQVLSRATERVRAGGPTRQPGAPCLVAGPAARCRRRHRGHLRPGVGGSTSLHGRSVDHRLHAFTTRHGTTGNLLEKRLEGRSKEYVFERVNTSHAAGENSGG
ncbi:hypothetical protein GR254_10825, partial [Mycobacterium tuberculosis]|nr:hypothetical protein [Mycobacterium tuberculosis]